MQKNKIDVSKYLTIFFMEDRMFSSPEILEQSILDKMEVLKKEYEYIIIDTTSNANYKHISTVLNASTKIVFLLEANLLGITKAEKSLEILINDINIDVDKIKIVFNKTNKYQIAESVLEEVFSNFEEIGNISYDEKYNLLINHNSKIIDLKNIYEIVC